MIEHLPANHVTSGDPASYGTARGVDRDRQVEELTSRLRELEEQVTTLREGMLTRERIGFVTGLLAQRYECTPEQAWELLSRVSQDTNVKARKVASVLMDVYSSRLPAEDLPLAAQIMRSLPPSPPGGPGQ